MSSSSLEMKWNKFGKNFLGAAILWIFIFIPYVAFGVIILQFIFINLALNEIKNINHQLNNPNLEKFYSKCLKGNIIKLIGLIVINVGGAMIAGALILRHFFNVFRPLWIFVPPIVVLMVGFILLIIASSIEMHAWENLKSFLQQNKEMFPVKIAKDVIDGADNLKSGTFSWALGFLFVPIIIGWIYQVVGYFKLASFNKLVPKKEVKITPIPEYQSTTTHIHQSTTAPIYQPIPTPIYQPNPTLNLEERDTFNFCPICGAKLNQAAKFCGECGSQLRS